MVNNNFSDIPHLIGTSATSYSIEASRDRRYTRDDRRDKVAVTEVGGLHPPCDAICNGRVAPESCRDMR